MQILAEKDIFVQDMESFFLVHFDNFLYRKKNAHFQKIVFFPVQENEISDLRSSVTFPVQFFLNADFSGN